MTQSAHNTTPSNRTKTMRFYPFVSTGKERDEETGYASHISNLPGNFYLQKKHIIMKQILVLMSAICISQLIISCNSTEYLSRENCFTCRSIIYDNVEESSKKALWYKYKKEEIDSVMMEMIKAHPADTLRGSFRVKEIWKELDVIVLFLEDLSNPNDAFRFKQVISLADNPQNTGVALKVGKIYYFELLPLLPINIAPSYNGEADVLLFKNHWLLINHYCGENIYSSINLQGDKYVHIYPKE